MVKEFSRELIDRQRIYGLRQLTRITFVIQSMTNHTDMIFIQLNSTEASAICSRSIN